MEGRGRHEYQNPVDDLPSVYRFDDTRIHNSSCGLCRLREEFPKLQRMNEVYTN